MMASADVRAWYSIFLRESTNLPQDVYRSAVCQQSLKVIPGVSAIETSNLKTCSS